MIGSIGKLFTTSDGKIPFTQIAIGILIGAIAMYVYVKIYKGDLPFGKKTATDLQPVESIEPLVAPPLPTPAPQMRATAGISPPQMRRRMPMKMTATMIPIPIPQHQYEEDDYEEDRIVEQTEDDGQDENLDDGDE